MGYKRRFVSILITHIYRSMKTIVVFLAVFAFYSVDAQITPKIIVSPLSSYEQVCDHDIWNVLNHEYYSFDSGIDFTKEVYIVHVDRKVCKGEEEVYLNSKGYTLLANPVNFFFGTVSLIDVNQGELIACPMQGKTPMLYCKEICKCAGGAQLKLTRSIDPEVWDGSPSGRLYFVCQKIEPL